MKTKEHKRLEKITKPVNLWKKWGPYLSERCWGTVREDYSENGNAWDYFPFEHAHKRAYKWGEDGIAGISDRYQVLCFSFAFWNKKDPILKERYFGLTSNEGNHGEDVKEYYYYLDATPTHSYLKCLYKYPFEEFPYDLLREENKKRTSADREFELIDTKIFDEDKYFDIFIEYAKNAEEDLCIKVEIFNRSDIENSIHIIPQLWFRNTWFHIKDNQKYPIIEKSKAAKQNICITADDDNFPKFKNLPFDYKLNKRYLYGSDCGECYFTDNETNTKSIWNIDSNKKFFKDAFHRKIVNNEDVVNPENKGTKACIDYEIKVPPKISKVLYFRLCDSFLDHPFQDIEKVFKKRKKEADEFYSSIQDSVQSEDEKNIQRQAFAGMIWSKQIYLFDVIKWLEGNGIDHNISEKRSQIRNNHWRHLNSMRIFSMPDKWEYPWFAAWDLAFQSLAFLPLDIEFAKMQIWQLLFDQFLHPNGQVPAYEWEFGDVNPPIQAFTALKIFNYEKDKNKKADYRFLEKCFHKMLLNFSWWVNKVDVNGNNVFEGGFLGLDNITVIDRSKKLPDGALLDQTDGSGWMGMFCLNMMKIALILSDKNSIYESLATKFFEHYVYIGAAMRKGNWRNYDTWDEVDGWFYSSINYQDNKRVKLKIRSLVGIIPFFAHDFISKTDLEKYPEFSSNFKWFLNNRSDLISKTINVYNDSIYVFSFMSEKELRNFFNYLWSEDEFKSQYGLRSISKYHEKYPFSFCDHHIRYEPGESLEKIKGGNSNWRGPIWFPTTYLLISTLESLACVYKDEEVFKDKNGSSITYSEMSRYFAKALISIFTKKDDESRAVFGDYLKMQTDPHFKDYLLFFEHYHGDTGRGLGASHQTGWSGLVAKLIEEQSLQSDKY